MNGSAQLAAPHQRLVDRAIRSANPKVLRQLVDSHPALRDPEVVQALCDQATKLLRVDVGQAEGAAELACALAARLDDPFLQARSHRARANVLHVRGEYETAMAEYEAALDRFDELGDELEAGITRSTALQTLAYLGRHDHAMEWADSARQAFDAAGDALRLARLELNVGTIIYRQERFEEARELMESAYERLLAIGGPADVAHCLRNLATVQIGLKNFEEAEDVYARARTYCEREDLPLLLGEVEYNVAYLHFLRGDYPKAIELYRRTRERCESTGEVYHRALCDLDEAEIYLELNLIDETLRCTDSAYRTFDQLGMRYEAAKALTYLALARVRQGKAFLALELLDRAREIFVIERNETWLALIDLYKAAALAREGRRFEAQELVEWARAVFLAAGLEAKVAASDALHARLELDAGNLREARRLCNRALERLAELDLPTLEHQALYLLGRTEERAGDPDAALAAFEAAHRSLARSRSSSHTDELKVPLLENNLEVYESLVTLLGEGIPSRGPEAIFNFMEIAKARNLVDLLAFRGPALPTRKARSTQVERVRRLREELNWYYRRIDIGELSKDEPSATELTELRRQTRATEDALSESLSEVELVDPEFVSLQTATTDRVDEIRSVLGADSTLVELYIARDTIYACTLRRDGLEVAPVSLASRVREIQRRFDDQVHKFRLGAAHTDRFAAPILDASRQALHDLYLELLEPLEPRLGHSGHLVVVPDGFLHWLPFSALHDGHGYLADRFSISYAPTATVFHRSRTQPAGSGRGALLLAATDGGRTEVETLAAGLRDAEVRCGSEASAASLRRVGGHRRLVHLETKLDFRSDNPMFSSLEFSDGRLNLFDLFGLELNTELTVLSGSGRQATPSDGDDWVGLARGLLYAGSRSVLMPFWDPPSASRTELLASFYRQLETVPSPALALQRAMLEMRQRHEHPFHWAAFALIGDPGRLD